jgi:hypothetical protein
MERRRLEQAAMVLMMSPRALDALDGRRPAETIVLPSPITTATRPAPDELTATPRDVAAVTYAGNPEKKRMQFILAEWARARRDGEELLVAGIDRLPGEQPGVRVAGRLQPDDYRLLLRRTKLFVAAPMREDYGIAPLEALSDGCLLVTTPAPGPYPALDLARALDPRLVGDDLAHAIRTALDDPAPGYAQKAQELLVPYGTLAVDDALRERVIPRLLAR